MRHAALVGEQPLQLGFFVGRAVPHDIVAAVAGPQIIVGPGHRIAEKLLARRQREGHEREQVAMHVGRKIAFRNQRPPGAIAGIERQHLRGALLAHGGANAVGAHQQIRAQRFTIGKMRLHPIRALREVGQPAPAVIVLRRKGVAQQPIDALPGGEYLRTFDFFGQAALHVDDLARGDLDAEFIGRQAERAQPGDQFGLRDDAGATAGQFAAHPLIDVHLPSRRGAATAR